ncbi:helix-turn-helix domain-containing protein [Bacillus sp. SM2101]|uniref:helix-turn-helix domain-containing protein n=1 Tax=Bacillus sp. SM2101 TaxID=2805366 RepID=UPI001BDDED37|nr:helix-turn-helix domain-containing protein [Bacillus sp. SM2101]
MKILLVFDSSLTPSDFHSINNVLETTHIQNVEQYNKLVEEMETKSEYRLIVFLTSYHSLPFDWRLSKLKATDFITFIGIKQKEIPLICNYLDTIGILSLKKSKNPKYETLLQNILQYINKNMQDNSLSLLTVSKEFNISPSYLSKLFKHHYGVGFREYLIKQRINKAKAMLRSGASVTDTCYGVGYGDLTHFSKIFRRYEGINPSIYRKKTTKHLKYEE